MKEGKAEVSGEIRKDEKCKYEANSYLSIRDRLEFNKMSMCLIFCAPPAVLWRAM
jgi:hypothetical protein